MYIYMVTNFDFHSSADRRFKVFKAFSCCYEAIALQLQVLLFGICVLWDFN